MITVVFRYDDYSAVSDTETEIAIMKAFGDFGFCCLFGIVPFVVADDWKDMRPQELIPLTPTKTEIIKPAIACGAVEPALHGYSHQTVTKGPLFSEFSGIKYQDQLARIREGRQFLERSLDMKIDLFIPPWNRFDQNTLTALQTLGFSCICPASDKGMVPPEIGLKMLPATSTADHLQKAIKFARRSADPQVLVSVLIHDFELMPGNPKFRLAVDDLREQMRWLRSQSDVKVCATGEVISSPMDLTASRFMGNKELNARFQRISPPFLRGFDSRVYLGRSGVRRWRLKSYSRLPLFYLTIAGSFIALSFFVGTLVSVRSPSSILVGKFAAVILLGTGIAYSLRDRTPSFRDLIVLTAIAGLCIGLWLAP